MRYIENERSYVPPVDQLHTRNAYMRLSGMRAFAAILIVMGSAVLGGCSAAPLPGLDLASFATETEAVAALTSAGDDSEAYGKNYCKDGVINAMQRGHWSLASELIKVCVEKGHKVVSTSVYKAVSSVQKKLKEMQALLTRIPRSKLNHIAPATQWGQSRDFIFLNVKFAHKMDTPATLGVASDNVTITSHGLHFEAHSETKNKRFKLAWTFPREVIPEESTWSMGAVGRATFQLKKRYRKTKWSSLVVGTSPKNLHVWWAMKEQYAGELSSLDSSSSDASAKKMEEKELEERAKEEATKQSEAAAKGSENESDGPAADSNSSAATGTEAEAATGTEAAPTMPKKKRKKKKKKKKKGESENNSNGAGDKKGGEL